MRCPRCGEFSKRASAYCQFCGLSLDEIEAQWGGGEFVDLPPVTDTVHCLRPHEKKEIFKALLAFETEFPQFHFSIFCGTLPAGLTVTEFGFWLINRASPPTDADLCVDTGAILLVIDIKRQEASLTPGYLLESLVNESDLTKKVLEVAVRAWSGENWADGILITIHRLTTLLRHASHRYKGFKTGIESRPPPPSQPSAWKDSLTNFTKKMRWSSWLQRISKKGLDRSKSDQN